MPLGVRAGHQYLQNAVEWHKWNVLCLFDLGGMSTAGGQGRQKRRRGRNEEKQRSRGGKGEEADKRVKKAEWSKAREDEDRRMQHCLACSVTVPRRAQETAVVSSCPRLAALCPCPGVTYKRGGGPRMRESSFQQDLVKHDVSSSLDLTTSQQRDDSMRGPHT
jgi:hypothetical protein